MSARVPDSNQDRPSPAAPGTGHATFAGALTRFSLNRRVTVLVLFLTIAVVGVIATLGIPVELFPRGFQMPALFVQVPWPNAPAEEVLEKITIPLEDELSTIRGLDGMNSWSSTFGCNVYLRFKRGTDMAIAYRETRDRLHRARVQFPEDVDRMFIYKRDASSIPVAVIGMAIDPELTDYYHLVHSEVITPLSRIDGVATVRADGLEEKEILIELDRKRAESNGLNIYELAQEMRADHFTMASGQIREAGRKLPLRSIAQYASVEELENRPITPSVRLKDVGRVRYQEAEKTYSVRVNGRPAVAVIVHKEGEANIVEVCRSIKESVEGMKENPRLSGVMMEMLFSQGEVVEGAVSNLVANGRVGGIFAALVLFLFLRRFRLTGIVTLSIPLSILMALVAMFFLGETLNLLTMLALVMCVGLLVDNSVVVAENIHRLHRQGLPRRAACVTGASEIALAITLATLTTVVVFLPTALVEGEGQFFLMRLALPISVSLIASLFVALVFIPLSVYMTLPRSGSRGGPSSSHEWLNRRLRIFYEATFGRLNRFYNVALRFFLQHRFDLVLMLGALFVLTQFVALKKVSFVEAQEEDRTSFNIGVETSNEYTFEDLAAYFREVEEVLEGNKERYGLRGFFIGHSRRGGRIEGWLEKNQPRTAPIKELVEQLLKDLPERPGIKFHYGREDKTAEAKGPDVFTIRLEGEEASVLDMVAADLEPFLRRMDGVLSIRMGEDQAPSELALVIDRERATASEVNPQVLAGLIGYALRGQSLPKFNDGGKEIPVRIRFQKEDRAGLDELSSFRVPTMSGETLPLSALVHPMVLSTPRGISRSDKRITRNLTLELKRDEAKQTRERLESWKKGVSLPEGVSFGKVIGSTVNEDLASMKFAAILSILFIYLLMGFLFESFILPLSIIFTIPLAALGVIWIHFLTGKDLDFLGVVGSILLIGVVVNNGIVLVDYVNRLRQEGLDRAGALLKAADLRFRPILMTALTTIIGMVPLAVSQPSEIGLSYKSFGLTLIGGMSTATLMTLLVVPVFYTFFDDLRLMVGRVLKTIMTPPGEAPRPEASRGVGAD